MRRLSITLLLLTVVLVCPQQGEAQQYPGTNLRGRIDSFNSYTRNLGPAVGVVVELFALGPAPGQLVTVGRTSTDYAGFYYFSRIRPGQYTLRVAGRMNFTIYVAVIDYRIYQFQDIPPVRF